MNTVLRGPACCCTLLALAACHAQNGPVIPTGAMRNTLFNGQLAGLIQLDSIAEPGVHGIGPLEHLRGELLLLDGSVFLAEATTDGEMMVEQRPASRAPFFVHQHVEQWSPVMLPDSVVDLSTLDAFLIAWSGAGGEPFAFRLSGPITSIDVHIVDVPMGADVKGPEDAHKHNKVYHMEGRNVDMVGFFSTKHKAVFTHHDTHIHVHAITAERDRMGHVDVLRFAPAALTLQVAVQKR